MEAGEQEPGEVGEGRMVCVVGRWGDGGGGGAVRKVQVVQTSRRTPEEAIATNS